MSLASWFYKAFTPKQELLTAARNLIKLIENDIEAAKLMAKLDGIELEQENAKLVRTTYRRVLNQLIDDWNNSVGNDEYRLKLTKIDHGVGKEMYNDTYLKSYDDKHTYQYTLRGKGINLAYRVIVTEDQSEYSKDKADEIAHLNLLISLSKAGINALNPEVYSGMSILPQAWAHERQELHI